MATTPARLGKRDMKCPKCDAPLSANTLDRCPKCEPQRSSGWPRIPLALKILCFPVYIPAYLAWMFFVDEVIDVAVDVAGDG